MALRMELLVINWQFPENMWSYVDIILGLTEHSSAQGTINNVLIILKYYIYDCFVITFELQS
jgi:hypothetical protein